MPVGWSSRSEGINDLEAFFEYAGYKARDLREPLRQSADVIDNAIIEQFASEGARSGGWEPLTERYGEWKMERDNNPMLQLSPSLISEGDHGTPVGYKMITALLDPGAWDITMHRANYEPDSTRAEWHQEGAERDRGGALPARPVLELLPEDYDQIEGIFEDWLDELRTANMRRGLPDSALRPGIFG